MPRYSAPSFSPIGRPPIFTPRPPLGSPIATLRSMTLQRPPVSGMRLIAPILKPPPGVVPQDAIAKGATSVVVSLEKPHTTVYVGKIATTVEDEFLRPLLELCGTIRSWKRAQDPTTGSLKGFGFCEFDTAEGVLRALRLLNKISLDGQELVLNVNQATREYLECYVNLKKEREIQLKERAQEDDKEEETAPGVEKTPEKPPPGQLKEDCVSSVDTESEDDGKKFGLVNDSDRQADHSALEKLTSIIEERARKPLPLPPALPTTSELTGKSSALEGSVKSKDGNLDETRSAGKNEDEMTSEDITACNLERPGISGLEQGRCVEWGRERDRYREVEREKENELERFERQRERERSRRERDREICTREVERLYKEREREWEARERERERQRLHDKEREKERERDRRREVKEQEEDNDDDDDWGKRHHRGNFQDEQRKRRQREREEDVADRVREEQELAKAKKCKIDEASNAVVKMEINTTRQPDTDILRKEESGAGSLPLKNGNDSMRAASGNESNELPSPKSAHSNGTYYPRRIGEDATSNPMNENCEKLNAGSAPRKFEFGIIGSGRRACVPSVFHQEDEYDTSKDHKLRPLVPIDYSAEELPAMPPNPKSSSKLAPNLVAAAEFAKSLSNIGNTTSPAKDDKKNEGGRDKSRRLIDKLSDRSRRDRDREIDRDHVRSKDWNREKEKLKQKDKEKDREAKGRDREPSLEKARLPENKNILDAKQLIDTIPKTKEELFAYPVNWSIYDKHELHERMHPWISKKITDFLGEEETTLVDFIVKNTQNHVTAQIMFESLEAILDDEAEMFVLKLWRMLIFEIRRIETGLAFRLKS
ncbi:hypothetical protein O6H91_04G025800 [Diphasiastrum complanatum]|nr:hypothetical protein O6H91_04G025800 [Diphasiastrum complanatum]